ncbi:hypothetical protein NCAS_0F03120 [Naumovozyma castellii]|uniref:Survival factor 1 n=1 Tax=Naumovozyma castellii TaxID=27288 RepID=G0VH24_NAUCA|nr:hypothetical protein NCAS_0F03120 [Naumovozyma castellii CBS 4309]CCC70796.1 hypothetical protein NCAS_0F03120 [Naumovozyma castellii CBS 4309]
MLKWIQGGLSAVTGIAEPEYGKECIHSVVDRVKDKQPYHSTSREDFFWIAPDHTNVETVTFYFSNLKTGIVGFAQIIHSNIIGIHTAAQFTFRIYDSKNPEELNLWTSTKLENFRIEGPNFYADNLSVELNDENTTYHFVSNVNEQSMIDLTFIRLTPGAKVGEDPTTYYGDNIDEPWGSMRHVFWPRNSCHGTIKLKIAQEQEEQEEQEENAESGESEEAKEEEPVEADKTNTAEQESNKEEDRDENNEDEGEDDEEEHVIYEDRLITFDEKEPAFSMFVMAFQGMKPHHAAKAWNFLYFHSKDYSAVLMEYTTPKSYANTKVSVGILTSDKEVLALTTDNTVSHLNPEIDSVGWNIPKNLKVEFKGVKSTLTDEEVENNNLPDSDKVTATVEGPLRNLVQRIDVMGEVPGFVKNIVSGVAGTKPYIYQYADEDFSLHVNNGKEVKGLGWAEVTFISESDVVTSESYNEE